MITSYILITNNHFEVYPRVLILIITVVRVQNVIGGIYTQNLYDVLHVS